MDCDYALLIPEFSLRNSDLSFLASEAALDIDNYIQGRSQEDSSINYLSGLLDSITQGEKPKVTLPDNDVVLAYAISGRERFEEMWQGRPLDEIVLQTNLVAKDLREFKKLPEDRQKSLRDFCINLSKEIAFHYTQYYSGSSRLAA